MLFYRGHIVGLAYKKYLLWMKFILSFCLKYETSTGTGQPTVCNNKDQQKKRFRSHTGIEPHPKYAGQMSHSLCLVDFQKYSV